eukprot:TRINITY_DN2328_c0_g2_i1.p2 TRINITY_DN2328_c0_g2~~TRINITY_DN2328_c0_g2_i1.p2  ORF type:complete len:330 (+),score=82.86 TRINITY_DN2328_c0_g2_i1:62-1051(+)
MQSSFFASSSAGVLQADTARNQTARDDTLFTAPCRFCLRGFCSRMIAFRHRSQSLELSALAPLEPSSGLSASEPPSALSGADLLRSPLAMRRSPLDATQRSVSELVGQQRLPRSPGSYAGVAAELPRSDPLDGHAYPPQQQLQNRPLPAAAVKAHPRASQGKYDAATVFMLRDFYRRVSEGGSKTVQDAAFQAALQETEFEPIRRHAALDALIGQPRLTFRALLRAMYPEAELRDLAAMVFLAYPPQRSDHATTAVRLQPDEQAELDDIFRLFDVDGDGIVNGPDFKQSVSNLHIPQALGRKLLRMSDLDQDGVLRREEFDFTMRRMYM